MLNNKKILHVNLYGSHKGGAENYIREIAAGMSEYGHYLLYALQPEPAYLQAFAGSYGVLNKGDDSIGAAIREIGPSCVIIYNIESKSMGVFLKLRRELGFKIIKSFHDYRMIYMGTGYNRITLRRTPDPIGWTSLLSCFTRDAFTRKIRFESIRQKKRLLAEVNEADAIEVHTEDMRKTLARNGIAPGKIYLNPPWASGCGGNSLPEDRSILFVGNLIRGKGPMLLLKALRKVHEKFNLKIVGDGYQRDRLQKYAASHKIAAAFMGNIPKGRLSELYGASSLVVVPSVLEPFGFVIVEAMSNKRAVIAFDAGGTSELIKNGLNGCLIKPFNLNELASRIEDFLRNPDKALRMGEKGYEIYSVRFTFQEHLKRLREKLTELEV